MNGKTGPKNTDKCEASHNEQGLDVAISWHKPNDARNSRLDQCHKEVQEERKQSSVISWPTDIVEVLT
jgi:hypothetical protein